MSENRLPQIQSLITFSYYDGHLKGIKPYKTNFQVGWQWDSRSWIVMFPIIYVSNLLVYNPKVIYQGVEMQPLLKFNQHFVSNSCSFMSHYISPVCPPSNFIKSQPPEIPFNRHWITKTHWPWERDPLSSTCRGIANIPILVSETVVMSNRVKPWVKGGTGFLGSPLTIPLVYMRWAGFYLVIYLSLWKMMEWKSVGMITFPTEWNNKKYIPNHLPVYIYIWCPPLYLHFVPLPVFTVFFCIFGGIFF